MKLLTKYFFNKDEMSEKDYSYARVGFIADVAFVNGAACFVAGSYLTGLLGMLGATEAQSNFILSLSMPAGFLQLLTPFLERRITHRKGIIFFSRLMETFLPAIAFLMPLIFNNANTSIIWLIGTLFFVKHIFGWTMSPIYNDMLMNCLSKDGGVGKFSGVKSSVTNIVACISAFTAGRIVKHFSGEAQIYGYMWLAVTALSFMVIEAGFLFFIKEPYENKPKIKQKVNLFEVFADMLKNATLRPYLKYSILHTASTYLTNPIISILAIQRLGMSLEILSYISMGSLILQTVLAPISGKIADKIGAKNALIFGLLLQATVFIINANMTTSNALILKLLASVVSSFAGVAISAPGFAFMFESLPRENRSSYISASSVLTLIISYIASLCATTFISMANGLNINIFGFVFHELNILLFLGAGIVILSAITLIHNKKPAD